MLKKISSVASFITNYARYDLKRECIAWLMVIKYYLPVLAIITIAALVALTLIAPFPKQQTYLAIGQSGSMADQTGREFATYFGNHGLSLNIQNTEGLDSGLHQLDADSSRINASFVTSGTATHDQFPELQSLGSVQVAPLWLFYRGKTIETDDPFEFYKDKLISTGAKGTVTNKLFNRLMELNNPGTGEKGNFLHLTHAEAAQALSNGKIEAMFIVDGFNSSVIQSLLKDPSVKVMNFPLADAYVRKLPFLQKVIVPRASIDIDNIRPQSDVTLLASSVNLLIEKDLHPAIQWAFLLASQDVNLKTEQFFTSAANYPKYKDKSFPLSPIAERFYKSGTPSFFNYLPFWLAALVENIWVELLTLFLVVLPLAKKALGFRSFASKKLLWQHFWELRFLEDELENCKSAEDLKEVISRLKLLESTVTNTWVEDQDMRHYYNLTRCIATTLQNATKKMSATT